MAIRSRISKDANVESVTANVISKVNINDSRGTADPKRDAYAGSTLDRMGVPEDMARPVVKGMAYNSSNGLAHPKDLPVQDLLSFARIMDNPGWNVEYTYRKRVRSPLTGIRGFCVVTCQSGSPKAVQQCAAMSCPLWAHRMGSNPHHGKR